MRRVLKAVVSKRAPGDITTIDGEANVEKVRKIVIELKGRGCVDCLCQSQIGVGVKEFPTQDAYVLSMLPFLYSTNKR